MRDHPAIIRDVGAQVIADLTGASIHTIYSWSQRKRIPAEHWVVLVREGHATADELMTAVAAKKAA